MPRGGTRTFLEPDYYEASLGQAQIEAVIVPRGKFKARLTSAELHHLLVLRCEEDFPRVGYVQLAPRLAFVTFPTVPGRCRCGKAEKSRRVTSSSTAAASGCISRRRDPSSGT